MKSLKKSVIKQTQLNDRTWICNWKMNSMALSVCTAEENENNRDKYEKKLLCTHKSDR